MPTIFIDGSEGTTGLQIRDRLAKRNDLQFISLPTELRKDKTARKEALNDADLVILCLPDSAAQESFSLIENPKVRVIDASTAHRTNPAWVYGFPELSSLQQEAIKTGRFVTNPGCYATGAIALLAPLLQKRMILPNQFYSIFGTSGYSGGGRQIIELCEGKTEAPLPSGLELYALGMFHKHVPEIVMFSGLERTPLFTPTISNTVRQGMFVEIPIDLKAGGKACCTKDLHACLSTHYQGQKYIKVMPLAPEACFAKGKLALDGLAGTDIMELYIASYEKADAALLIARLDNLGKGASGAAVQNMNLMLG